MNAADFLWVCKTENSLMPVNKVIITSYEHILQPATHLKG